MLKTYFFLFIIVICLCLSGCALLSLPLKVVGGTLNIIGEIVKGVFGVIKSMPKPPPGVFF